MKIDGTIYDADAIREMEAQAVCAAAEIARLRAALDAMTAERDAANSGRDRVRRMFRRNVRMRLNAEAQRDGAKADADNWHQKCLEAEADRDAARAKALEDAAKEADYYATASPTARSIAAAIRAMIEQEDKG